MNLVSFDFRDNTVRSVVIDNEPWFIAKDVCEVLELADVSKACSRLDEDEKGTNTVPTLGGIQDLLIINESGLYSLILTSRKPQAKEFKKWVTSEVLPSIRKTGKYEVETKPQFDVPTTFTGALRLALEQAEMLEKQNLLIEQQKPAVEFVERYVESKSTKAISAVAKILGAKQKVFISWLVEREYLYKRSGSYFPYSTYDQYFEVKTGEANGHVFSQTKFTPAGIEWVSKKWNTYISDLG